MRAASLLVLIPLSACNVPGGPYPSLQPRAAERIDPRLPVERPLNNRPASATLIGRLTALVGEARSGDAAFASAAANAERLAANAGPPQSESWIAAQEALTAAIAARKPTATALGDIDELGARALQVQGGMAPNDLAAIDRASAEVAAINQRQVERTKSIQRRLGT